MRWPWSKEDPDPSPRVKMVPYKDLPEKGRVKRRIEELRLVLEWGSRHPSGTMEANLGPGMTPHFVHDLIQYLDECERDKRKLRRQLREADPDRKNH